MIVMPKYPMPGGGDAGPPARIALEYRFSREGNDEFGRNKKNGATYQENLTAMIRASVSCETQEDEDRVYDEALELDIRRSVSQSHSLSDILISHAEEEPPADSIVREACAHILQGLRCRSARPPQKPPPVGGDVWWTPLRKSIMFFKPF